MQRLADVQWVSSIFDEAAVEFEVVSQLTPDVLLNGNLREQVGEEIAFLIHEHLELEMRYRSLLEEGAGLRSSNSDPLFESSLQLCDSLRAICRRFRAAPALLQNLDRSRRPIDATWYQVLQHVGTFFHLTRTKLVACADDDSIPPENQLDDLNTTVSDERKRQHELTKTLAKQRADHSMKMAQRAANIEKLEREILKARNGLAARALKLDEANRIAMTDLARDEDGDRSRAALVQDIGNHIVALKAEGVEHVNKFRKELRRIHLEMVENIASYDDVMIRMTTEIEMLAAAVDADQGKLKDLRVVADGLVAEREAHDEQVRETNRRNQEEERVRNAAAVHIQRVFRGWKTRRDLSRPKSKSKAKGKKKPK